MTMYPARYAILDKLDDMNLDYGCQNCTLEHKPNDPMLSNRLSARENLMMYAGSTIEL
jgi:hypothetical protein